MNQERLEELLKEACAVLSEARFELVCCRAERKMMIEYLSSALKLSIDFAKTADHQKFELALKKLADREGVRRTVDNWFWRPEPNLDPRRQLLRRAKYLKAKRFVLDDAWDLLVDYIAGWSREPSKTINENLLKSILAEAYDAGAA
jgi:hypothetical protein